MVSKFDRRVMLNLSIITITAFHDLAFDILSITIGKTFHIPSRDGMMVK